MGEWGGGGGRWGSLVMQGEGEKPKEKKPSPPHFQSLRWLNGTAAGGSASGVQSAPAAGRSPGRPEEWGKNLGRAGCKLN